MPSFTYLAIHKPFKVLSQFTSEDGHPGLGDVFDVPSGVYPVGRLDLDSEGLLILTNDKQLNHQLLNPAFNHKRTYWVEVEGQPDKHVLDSLSKGVEIRINKKTHLTRPAKVQVLDPNRTSQIPERIPAVNYTKHPMTTWISMSLTEGKNRQVRRMTAAVGHPTLRLIRVAIEDLHLWPLSSGEQLKLNRSSLYKKLGLT